MTLEKTDIESIFISIVIPVLNGERYIKLCLDSIFNIDYPKKFYEVILVDNGSTDKTVKIAQSYDIKTLIKPKVTISAVRNYGVIHSRGDILAFVDSDCLVSKDWIKNAIHYFENDTIGMVGSHYQIPEVCNWVGKAWTLCVRKRGLRGEIDHLPGGNMLIRRKCFEYIQGFDENLITCEDDDICYRLRKCGYKIYSDPNITVFHFGDCLSLSKFFRKQIWRGLETFKLFVRDNGGVYLKSTMYALLYLFAILCMFLSTMYALTYAKGYIFIGISLVLIIIVPLYLAATAAIRSKKWKFFFHFTILYFTFGIARAIAIFRPR